MLLTQPFKNIISSIRNNPYLIWSTSVLFVLFQFFMQLSAGVVIAAITQDYSLTAFKAGLLASGFYYTYTLMQIPVGMLFDCKNARQLLTVTAGLSGLGCLYFAHSYLYSDLLLGRLLIGLASSFAFVGLSHLIRLNFPLKKFGFLMGLSETLAFLVTVASIFGMTSLMKTWGWRGVINVAGIVALTIAFFCGLIIPNYNDKSAHKKNYKTQLFKVFFDKKAWLNGTFVGLEFAVVTVFAAMWAIPFLRLKCQCTLTQASIVDSMFFLGAAISCPLFGLLANLCKRRPIMISSCLSTGLIILCILFFPSHNLLFHGLLFFSSGICCGAYMLSFSIANELAPEGALSTWTGFTNTLGIIAAPILQPLLGQLLDYLHLQYSSNSDLLNYQLALLAIPFCLLIASGIVFYLPEKNI